MEYTKRGFYDNDTQNWSDWYAVEVGHEGNFVYDKTTDSVKVNFYSATKPNIKVNQWAFLGHFADNISTTLTYDTNGLSLNHEQYIVAKFEKQEQKNGKWYNTLALIEPIEAMRGIITETLSFTNQTEKIVQEDGVDVTYEKSRYNCLTALERILKVTPANNNLINSWWSRINILDGEFLVELPFNDDTLTASDLFTILFKFDDIIDRTPVIYFDMVNLGVEKKYLLKFERKDGFDKTELDYDTLIGGNIGLVESDSIDTYATSVVSEVDNLATNNRIIFPSVNMWAMPEYDNEERDVPTDDTHKGEFFIKLPYNIKRIVRIDKMNLTGAERIYETEVILYSALLTRQTLQVDDKYILEKQNYLASSLLDTNKDNLIWYEEGTDKVYINEYYSNTDNTTSLYRIEFEPLLDVAMEYGKNDFQISINQSDSQVESLKYTKFLENYLKGMNKADVVFTKVYYNFNDFKDLTGSLVLKDNEQYIISNISYKNANQLYIVAFQLNKSNLRRNANVKANEQIRANKAIDYKNLKDRRSRYVDFIKLDKSSQTYSMNYLTNKLLLLSALIPTQISENYCPQIVIFKPKSMVLKNGEFFEFTREFILSFSKIINKGQIEFNIKTQDNAQIGTQKQPYENTDYEYISNIGDVVRQLPIIYPDPFGEVQKVDFLFTRIDLEEYVDYNDTGADPPSHAHYLEVKAELDRTLKMFNTMANLPIIPADYKTELIANKIFEITEINKYKDMLEIENDNFIFNVGSDNKDIIVCQPLLELSRIIEPTDTHTLKVLAFAEKKGENDIISNPMYDLLATSIYDNEKITLSFSAEEYGGNLKSIIITTNDYKKLLIINNPSETDVSNGFINIYY